MKRLEVDEDTKALLVEATEAAARVRKLECKLSGNDYDGMAPWTVLNAALESYTHERNERIGQLADQLIGDVQ